MAHGSVVLRTLAGGELPLRLQDLSLDERGIVLSVSATPEAWSDAERRGDFLLDVVGEPLEENGDVHAELVLRQPFVPTDSPSIASATALFERLQSGQAGTAQQVDAWLLLSAVQSVEVPDTDGLTVEIGFRTPWARTEQSSTD